MNSGYSQKPLVVKLGIKPRNKILLLNNPADYLDLLVPLPEGIEVNKQSFEYNFIQLFIKNKKELEEKFPHFKDKLAKDGQLWISWRKQSSKVTKDLNENIIREIGLKNGLVDVKVAAIDETWSGLKFVYRIIDR